MRGCIFFFFMLTVKRSVVHSVMHFGPLPIPYPLPLCCLCLLSHRYRRWLRASGVLWLSINSGVWSISLQLLQKNRAQRAMFKPWLGLVFNKRFFFCFTVGATYPLNWPDRPHANKELSIIITLCSLFSLFLVQLQNYIFYFDMILSVLHSLKWFCNV